MGGTIERVGSVAKKLGLGRGKKKAGKRQERGQEKKG